MPSVCSTADIVSGQMDDIVYGVARDHDRADGFGDTHLVAMQVLKRDLCSADEADCVNCVQSDDPVPCCQEDHRACEAETDQHTFDGVHEESSLALHPGPLEGCGLIDRAKAGWGVGAEVSHDCLPSLVHRHLTISRPLRRPY